MPPAAPWLDERWIPFTPDAAVDAFAVMEATGYTTVDDEIVIETKQPATTGGKLYFINGPHNVGSGGYGVCTLAFDKPAWVIYDSSDGTPAAGEGWGPKSASWKVTPSDDGFICVDAADESKGLVLVLQKRARVRKGELIATYHPGESGIVGDTSVAAQFHDHFDEEALTIQFQVGWQQGIGRAGAGEHAGTMIPVTYNSRTGEWEPVATETSKLIAFGVVDEGAGIANGASGTIKIYWKDYTTGNMVDSSETVEALNWARGALVNGQKVVVSFDRQEMIWYVI